MVALLVARKIGMLAGMVDNVLHRNELAARWELYHRGSVAVISGVMVDSALLNGTRCWRSQSALYSR